MQGEPAIYRGKIVDKKHFRVFVYNANGDAKLVESWEKFQDAMQSGIWFATKAEALTIKAIAEIPPEPAEKEEAAPEPEGDAQEATEVKAEEKPKQTKPTTKKQKAQAKD